MRQIAVKSEIAHSDVKTHEFEIRLAQNGKFGHPLRDKVAVVTADHSIRHDPVLGDCDVHFILGVTVDGKQVFPFLTNRDFMRIWREAKKRAEG